MIPNYNVPQTTIAQVLETTSNPLLDRLHAVVVGPAYKHVDVASDNLLWGDYSANAELAYASADGGPDEGAVDLASVQLFSKKLMLSLYTKGTATLTPTTSQFKVYTPAPTGDLIQFNNVAGFLDESNSATVAAYDFSRAPQVGDIFRITSNLGTVDRKVSGLAGKDIAGYAGDTGYVGALPWVDSSADYSIEVASSSLSIGTPTFTTVTAPALLEARRKGTVAPEGGLRLALELTCATAGTGSTAVFTAKINGATVAVSNATNVGNTRFTFLTSTVMSVALNAWAVGDRFTVFLDFANDGDLDALGGGNVDLSLVTYAPTVRRKASTLVVEVLAVPDSTHLTLRISDTAGLATTQTATTAAGILTVDYDGVTLDIDIEADFIAAGHVGQRYTLLVLPAARSTTLFDKVRLSAPLGMDGAQPGIAVTALVPFSGYIPAEEPILGNINFVADATGVTLGSIAQSVAGYPAELDSVKTALDATGTVSVVWRAEIPVGASEGLVPIDNTDDILDFVGSAAMASELGFALAKALSGSQGKRIYGLKTAGASREAFQAAILKLEAANYIYAIAVLTDDEQIMRDFSAHARLSSQKEIKRFRRAYVGTDSPGEYPILENREDSTPYLATISAGDNGYNLVTFTEVDVDLETLTISEGDKLLIPGVDETFVIDRVTGENTLVLKSGPLASVAATAMQLIAADTPENVGRFVYGRSQRIGLNAEDRRHINNVWVDNGIYDDGVGAPALVPNRFGAAEVAGLRTAVQPQQSLTRTEVGFITDAPSMYTRFSAAVLNEMAANGVWIITQNSPDTTPYIRHQITAEVSSGSLFYEDSAGVNIDSICFAIDDVVDPLIGKRNATSRTVIEIKNKLLQLLGELTESGYASLIGPQLVNFYNLAGESGTLDVAIDPILKDTINVSVVLEIPLPLNNIRVTVLARTIRLDGGTVVNALTTSTAA